MTATWAILLTDVAIITAVIWLWGKLKPVERQLSSSGCAIFLGTLMGLAAIALMLMPAMPVSGVFIDLRVVPVALAGLFGGPLAAIAASVIASVFRLQAGGAGIVAGVLAIAVAGAAGSFVHLRNGAKRRTPWQIVRLAGFLAPASLACLLVLPPEVRSQVIPAVWFPLLSLVFVGTVVGGLAFLTELGQQEMARANLIYRQVIDSLPDCLNAKDMEGRFIFANPATAMLMQAASADALTGKTDFDFYPANIAKMFQADEAKVIAAGKPLILEQHFSNQVGGQGWLSSLKVPLLDEEQRCVGVISHNRDITDKKSLEYRLAVSQQHFSDALANMADGLAMFDANGILQFYNDQYAAMFPKTQDLRVAGKSAREILQASIQRGELLMLPDLKEGDWEDCLREHFFGINRLQYQLFDQRWIETRSRYTTEGACFVICSDITHAKEREAQLVNLNRQLDEAAHTDGLTGLANRRAFDQRLEHDIHLAHRHHEPMSLLMIDADRFKAYNDTYGHLAGDECLRRIAGCLTSVARRQTDLAARYGGEEMALILPVTSGEDALKLAQRFHRAVRDLAIPHSGSSSGMVTVSAGLATLGGADDGGVDAAVLINRADEALYQAKSAGRDAVCRWQPPLRRLKSDGMGARS